MPWPNLGSPAEEGCVVFRFKEDPQMIGGHSGRAAAAPRLALCKFRAKQSRSMACGVAGIMFMMLAGIGSRRT